MQLNYMLSLRTSVQTNFVFQTVLALYFFICVTTEAPPPHEHYDADAGIKRVTEYFVDDDGKKIKVKISSGYT